ncbi:AraC family transcriptional regulator [Arachidicoccus sp.]|uniref:AraC family transcriptional regulator n=1 Tax=Arachidicoccus sp. TaxID=1872624 RepID=UPI003D237CE8
MKPQLLKISSNPAFSFSVRHDKVAFFYDKWHYHPELELVHILKGRGTQFIGNDIARFSSGDMILVGANLPHLWRCDEEYYQKESLFFAQADVLHFSRDALGTFFWEMPENKALSQLLQRAKQGIIITGKAKLVIAKLLKQLTVAKDSERIILLLQILNAACNTHSTKTILSTAETHNWAENSNESERMNNVYQYILQHFQEKISLQEISDVAHISPHSFCRFFKSRAQKSFSTFLTEVRINHACRLLAETDHPVADICYESGFYNFSNFNRHFKLLTKKSPLQHRQMHQYFKAEK